ncbi:MAG: TonB-dependent receptor [Myxococcales bacterium]|nr:TonB-dependent receptor [Myxococcales bacterium]
MRTTLAKVALAAVLLAARSGAEPKPSLLHTAPTQAKPGEQLQIEGSLVNGAKIDKVVIRVRGPGEEYADLRMELQYGDLFRGYIPASRMVPPGVEYYVEGFTFSGDRVMLFSSAAKPARVLVLGTPEREPPEKEARRTKEKPPDRALEEAKADRPHSGKERPPQSEEAKSTRQSAEESGAKRRSQLEDELALYSAEDTVALATRHEEKVTRVPAIASSVNQEQIRAMGARSVYDVLDALPGLSVSRDVQGFYRVAIRGIRSEPEVLFLLNGHRLDNFFDGKALASLPVENIERVEVIRGPSSALHGAGAFIGVVNIVTSKKEGVRAAASGGMYETFDGHLGGAVSLGTMRLFADADYLQQRGYEKPVAKDSLDKDTVAQNKRQLPDPAGQTKDRRRLVNVGAGLSFEPAAGSELGLSARFLNEDRAALVGLFDAVGPDSALAWQVLQADLAFESRWKQGSRIRARGYFDQQRTGRLFQLTPDDFRTSSGDVFPDGMLERTDVGVRTFGAEASADLSLAETNRLSLGAVGELQNLFLYSYVTNYTSDNRFTGGPLKRPEGLEYPQELARGAAASRLTLGLFAQDQWTVIEKLTLTFGFRLDARTLPALDADKKIVGAALVPSLNPRFGAVFAASEALVFKLLYGRAFRSPTVQELTESIPNTDYNQGRFEGNPDLDPAVVDTLEIGADLVQAAGEARVRLRGNAFYARFTNPIAQVDTSGNIVPLRNRQGVQVYGLEGEARLEASARANAWVNASWHRAMDVETPTPFWLLTDTPQARLNAGVSMPLGDFLNLDLTVRTGSERRNASRSVLELVRRWKAPAYTLVTAQLRSEPIAEHFEVALVGHNLLDQDYVDDVPRPDRITALLPREGASAFLTVRASY